MNREEQIEPSNQSFESRKAELEAALRKEKRMSRRQDLLKKLWKLKQGQAEGNREPASSTG